MKRKTVQVLLAALLVTVVSPVAFAQESSPDEVLEERIRILEEEIRKLRAEYERLIGQIEEESSEGTEDDDLEALRTEAERAAKEAADRESEAEALRETSTGKQRSLQKLNPEISFLGDISYDWSDSDVRNQFLLRGVEINFQAPLDPYTRFKGFIAAHQEAPEFEDPAAPAGDEEEHGDIEVEIEEVYMEWVALPLNTRLRVGKFRQQFGTLNRWHEHALPSVEAPFALRNVFGHEGLEGIGVGADWGLPSFWASSNKLTLEITNASNDASFAGSEFDDPAWLLRHTGFFDLGESSYFEIGLNGMKGPNNDTGDRKTRLLGVDFNFLWEPPQKARYRGIELRGEWIHSRFEESDEVTGAEQTFETASWYTYLVFKVARRWSVGFRYDDAELPSPRAELFGGQTYTEGLREKAISPMVTFWQSEFVRMRLQYQHASRDFAGHQGPDDDDRVWFQVTFAAGPHKHEEY